MDWIHKYYRVEENGQVFSLRKQRHLKTGMGTNGRPFVILWDGKKQHIKYIHVLVAETFIGPRPEGLDVSHLDDNKLNNHKNNLIYETRLENIARRRLNGYRDDGFHNSRAVLRPGDPEKIRELRASGKTHKQIADIFDVSRTTISRVLNNERYGEA